MKKLLSVCLLLAILASSLLLNACIFASASAGEASPLSVELVSGKAFSNGVEQASDKTTLGQYFYGWTPIFNSANTTTRVTPFVESGETIEVVGRLSEPSEIGSIVFRTCGGGDRLNGVVVMFSVDGTNWTKGITLQKLGVAANSDVTVPIVGDKTAYSYVKIFKSGKLENETQNAVKGSYLDLYHVRFYREVQSEDQPVKATYQSTVITEPSSNLSKFFDYGNAELCSVSGTAKGNLVIGKFKNPTVINHVYLSYFGASANWTTVKASVDGQTWVPIAEMTGIWANAANPASETIAYMTVSDNTAYNYIMIERKHEYGSGWKAYSIGFGGVEQGIATEEPDTPTQPEPPTSELPTTQPDGPSVPATPSPVWLSGYQRAVNADGSLALRLIGVSENYNVGPVLVKLNCEAADGRTWQFEVSVSDKKLNFSETVDGKEWLVHAEDLDGAYIFFVVLDGIPADLAGFTVSATPVVVVNGETVEGATKTLALINGQFVQQ